MPRGKTVSGAETRNRILVESSRLFAVEGFRAVSLREIARATGIGSPSVLHHFPDGKLGIYQAIIQVIISQTSLDVANALATSNRHAALSIAETMWDFFAANPQYAALILRSGFESESEEGKQFQQAGSQITKLVKSVVNSSTGYVVFKEGEMEEVVFVMGIWCLNYHGSPALTRNIWLFPERGATAKELFLQFLEQKFDLEEDK